MCNYDSIDEDMNILRKIVEDLENEDKDIPIIDGSSGKRINKEKVLNYK